MKKIFWIQLYFYLSLTGIAFGQSSPANSFFVIHCDPQNASNLNYAKLQQMVDTATAHNVPLTIEISPSWASLILTDTAKLDNIRTWQQNGHEIAAHITAFTIAIGMDLLIILMTQLSRINQPDNNVTVVYLLTQCNISGIILIQFQGIL